MFEKEILPGFRIKCGMSLLLSSPTRLGIQCFLSFSLLFSFSVIPEILKHESMLFFSLILKERNTSWIPAFAGMTSPLSSPKTTPMSSPTWLGIQALLILDSCNRSEWQKVFLYQVWYNKTSVILENTPTVILESIYRDPEMFWNLKNFNIMKKNIIK